MSIPFCTYVPPLGQSNQVELELSAQIVVRDYYVGLVLPPHLRKVVLVNVLSYIQDTVEFYFENSGLDLQLICFYVPIQVGTCRHLPRIFRVVPAFCYYSFGIKLKANKILISVFYVVSDKRSVVTVTECNSFTVYSLIFETDL